MSLVDCAVCGKPIHPAGADPLALRIDLPGGGEQRLWTHVWCLRRVIRPNIALAVLDDELESPAATG